MHSIVADRVGCIRALVRVLLREKWVKAEVLCDQPQELFAMWHWTEDIVRVMYHLFPSLKLPIWTLFLFLDVPELPVHT